MCSLSLVCSWSFLRKIYATMASCFSPRIIEYIILCVSIMLCEMHIGHQQRIEVLLTFMFCVVQTKCNFEETSLFIGVYCCVYPSHLISIHWRINLKAFPLSLARNFKVNYENFYSLFARLRLWWCWR
jgi:hypothetical protein